MADTVPTIREREAAEQFEKEQTFQQRHRDVRRIEEKAFECVEMLKRRFVIFRVILWSVHWVPPLAIFMLLLFVYLIFNVAFCYMQVYQTGHIFVSVFSFLLFHIIFGLTMTSFSKAIYTDPGYVTEQYYERISMEKPLFQENDDLDILDGLPSKNQHTECAHCEKPKPPRSHHCKHCGTCVRKMDHHCPVINNCVGWGNYKFFLLLLTWASVLCIFGTFCGIFKYGVIGITENVVIEILLAIGTFIAVVYGIMLATFAGMHYYMVIQNTGTLDSLIPIFKKQRNIYDLGPYRNFLQVFGRDKRKWFLPVFTSMGDGYHYPTNGHRTESSSEEKNIFDV